MMARNIYSDQLAVASDQKNKEENYWLNKFSGEVTESFFAYDFKKQGLKKPRMDAVEFRFSGEMFSRLMQLINDSDVRLYTVLVSGLILLLHRYTGNKDIIVGAPIYKQEIDVSFINTVLPLRNRVEDRLTVKDLLLQTGQVLFEAAENQNYPIETLLYQLNIPFSRDEDFPLFHIAVLLENIHEKRYIQHLKLDMHFIFNRTGESIEAKLEYDPGLYLEASVRRIVEHFTQLLEEAVFQVKARVSDLDMMPGEERQQILFDFNNTGAEYPGDRTIIELFAEQAARIPAHTAVIGVERRAESVEQYVGAQHAVPLPMGHISITYKELNEKSEQLAYLLREKGVKADTVVGIMVERSIEMMIGIFGILKAGGAYLPIDPDYPPDRIDYMLKDSNAGVLVSELSEVSEVSGGIEVVKPGELSEELPTHLTHLTHPTQLGYVIYTSGSTGRPKGVMIGHRSLVNRLNWMQKSYSIGEKDVILQKTTIIFDVSVWELFWWSIRGASVCLLGPGEEKDPEAIAGAIYKHNVTVMHFVPSMLNIFLEYFESGADIGRLSGLRWIISSGEALMAHQVERFYRLFRSNDRGEPGLVNLYGPTEAAVDVSYYNCPRGKYRQTIPIGKPIDNIRLYIVSKEMHLQPVGIAGELYISGVGVARGYLNRPQLTAEKFDHDLWDFQDYQDGKKKENYQKFLRGSRGQFFQKEPPGRRRLYKTGDLARWLPDGNIEFLGRKDFQVKIRGFRIELGEIEDRLLQHEKVKDAVVTDRESGYGDRYLCAYIVSDNSFHVSLLRDYLSRQLPEYMIPAYFAVLEEIPLTASGKVDRKALPAPGIPDLGMDHEYIAPRNETEQKIAAIWSEALGVERIGIHDNFFELGGHSLKAVSIITRINKELKAKFSLSVIFDNPTIAGIVEELMQGKGSGGLAITKCPASDHYELSHAQKRLWFFTQMAPDNPAYNIPMTIRYIGELDTLAFEKAIDMLVQRHESLRTAIKVEEENGLPVQIIHEAVKPDILHVDISRLPGEEKRQKLRQLIRETGVKPFDLARAPLFRTGMIKSGPRDHVVVFVMHHIICDGWSLRVMIREFSHFYDKVKGNPVDDLPSLTFQYKDFVYWQDQLLTGRQLTSHRDYWINKLGGELPILELPADFPRYFSTSSLGEKITFTIDEPLTQKLKILSGKAASSLYMVLIAAFKVLLYRYSQQEDIIIGTLTAGRSIHEWEKIVGYFVNILALRDTVKGKRTFQDFLGNVRKTILDAFDHQEYPFDKLVDELNVKRDTGRTPVFDIMVVFQNYEEVQLKSSLESLKMEVIEKDYVVNKYDLYLDIMEMSDHLQVDFEFRNDLYKKETISRMAAHYLNILDCAAGSPDRLISEIDMLSRQEKTQLLTDFNATARDIPRDRCYQHLFERQVSGTPGDIAARHNGRTVTYKELDERANRVAHHLLERGVRPNTMVALYMRRSIHMLASIIGIFKTGAAYLPVEVDYPEERIRYMLQHAEVTAALADRASLGSLAEITPDMTITATAVDDVESLGEYPADTPRSRGTPDDYAYMIYTSGTTGRPKGALIHQLGMINHLYAKIDDLVIDENDRIAHTASPCFDISVWQFLAALLRGGTTVIFDYETVLNPKTLLRGLQQEKITIFESVPSLITVFLEMLENNEDAKLDHLRWMIPTGEALKPSLVKEWFRYYPGIKLVNAYGPTEASDDITHHVVNHMSDVGQFGVPIGKPVQNMRIYILDKDFSLCPVGVRGEICTAGLGVGKGYWREPEKTRQVFIANPYAAGAGDQDYAVLYRTGDMGYFREDGSIECLGRIDNQVKIRGYRIELEEIETVMLTHQAVSEAAVVVKQRNGKADSLVGFLVEKEPIDIETLKKFLLQYLPPYMIPSIFVKLDGLPLSLSGKIDRQELAAMEIETAAVDSKEGFTAPRSETEKQIAEIWAEALELDNIGIYDNFFDLGGHSLLIPRIHRRLEKQFPGRCEIADLFEYMTVFQLARRIEGTLEEEDGEIIELEID
jgi:tyrocidine synthetase-3